MNKISNKQNRNRFIETESRLTAIRGEEVGGWVIKGKGLSKGEKLIDKDKSRVIARGKRGGKR